MQLSREKVAKTALNGNREQNVGSSELREGGALRLGGGVKKAGEGGIVCGRRLRAAPGKAAPRVSGRARNAAGASKSCTFAFTSLAACFFRKDFLSVVII